jgi:glucosamine--fructose-6-phosphate aminotransferase (isomerizing)
MCGIVGYIGKREAYPILIKGLKRLEYRGYDSAGVALLNDHHQLNVYKTKGKVSDLEAFVTQKDISEKLVLIHNGIIENYAVLKEKLQAKGYDFKSTTDTEVLVVATQNGLYEKVLSNIQEIKARKGKVIAFVTRGDTVIKQIADFCVELPRNPAKSVTVE